MNIQRACVFTAVVLAISACGRPGGKTGISRSLQDSRRSYEVRGIVRSGITGQNSVIIEHEDIPGFMPSMTMPFGFKDRQEVEGLRPGDGVQFQFVLSDKDSWIEQVKKIDSATVRLPQSAPKPAAVSAPRVKEGNPMPAFQLVDQDGHSVTRETYAGRTLLFTFIFTRCPVPNFCPRMSQNFTLVQEQIASDPALRPQLNLLSISFDPEHDTPEVLKQYAAAFSPNRDSWKFATGTKEEIGKLTKEFSVYIREEGGTLSHGLCTVMVGPDGVIRKIWRGNAWEVAEVLNAVRNPTAAQ